MGTVSFYLRRAIQGLPVLVGGPQDLIVMSAGIALAIPLYLFIQVSSLYWKLRDGQ